MLINIQDCDTIKVPPFSSIWSSPVINRTKYNAEWSHLNELANAIINKLFTKGNIEKLRSISGSNKNSQQVLAGKCVSKDKKDSYKQLSICAKRIFKQRRFANLSIATLYAYLNDKLYGKVSYARLSKNTFTREVKAAIPQHTFSKQRRSKQDIEIDRKNLKIFFDRFLLNSQRNTTS